MDNNAGFVGSIPEHYDRGLGPVLFADYADDMARRVAATDPRAVLETAAGTGILTRRLRDALAANARIVATDLNAPMLEVARRKFRPAERVDFQVADAMALPFPDGSFDAVACQFGIMFYPDRDQSFREVHRVLAPEGRYFFSVWDAHGHNAFGRIVHEIVERVFPDEPPQFYRVPFSCAAIDPIKEALAAAGFGEITISVLPLDRELGDLAGFTDGLVYGNPLLDQIVARGGDPEAVRDAVAKALRKAFGDPARMRIQTILYDAARR